MKKLLAFTLIFVIMFSMVSCNSSKNTENKPDETTTTNTESETTTPESNTTAPEPEIPTVQLNETVSTDIVDFTLESSQFAIYLSNLFSTYVQPTDKPNSMFAAKIGTCYVSMTVTISNKDRGGSINFGGSFNRWDAANWTVIYKDTEYDLYGFDLNNDNCDDISLSYSMITDKDWNETYKPDSSNELIGAGQTYTIRLFGIIHVEPDTLNDGFELTVDVPNSKGEYEKFEYIVPAIS